MSGAAAAPLKLPRLWMVMLEASAIAHTPGSLAAELKVGRLLFNRGLYFDCHEFLELSWRRSEGEAKLLLQGLIQAAAGLHKLELGGSAGCLELLGKAAAKLASCAPRDGFEPRAFVPALLGAAESVRKGTFRWEDAPEFPPL